MSQQFGSLGKRLLAAFRHRNNGLEEAVIGIPFDRWVELSNEFHELNEHNKPYIIPGFTAESGKQYPDAIPVNATMICELGPTEVISRCMWFYPVI